MTVDKTSKNPTTTQMGRPKIDIDLVKVEELAGKGLTDAQLAVMLGISPKTLYTRKVEDIEFALAYERGEAMALAEIEETMFSLAKGGDAGACKFILSTRRRDTYTTRQELANPTGYAFRLETKPLTPEERQAAIIDITKALDHET